MTLLAAVACTALLVCLISWFSLDSVVTSASGVKELRMGEPMTFWDIDAFTGERLTQLQVTFEDVYVLPRTKYQNEKKTRIAVWARAKNLGPRKSHSDLLYGYSVRPDTTFGEIETNDGFRYAATVQKRRESVNDPSGGLDITIEPGDTRGFGFYAEVPNGAKPKALHGSFNGRNGPDVVHFRVDVSDSPLKKPADSLSPR